MRALTIILLVFVIICVILLIIAITLTLLYFPLKCKFQTNFNDQPDFIGYPPVMDDFLREMLDAHNYYRQRHGAPYLQISEPLNSYAADWVQTISRSRPTAFIHRDELQTRHIGENIYRKDMSGYITGKVAVRKWYKQKYNYNFTCLEMNTLEETGSFAQVVWASTRELGCAYSKKEGKLFVVCNYTPAGNVEGDYARNVRTPARNV